MSKKARNLARKTRKKIPLEHSRREKIKRAILYTFYAQPFEYWNNKLRAFCSLNAQDTQHCVASAGICYENTYWHPEWNIHSNIHTPNPELYYLEISDTFKEKYEKDFLTCITVLGELRTEVDCISRFLSYALAFNVSSETFLEELGSDILAEYFQDIELKTDSPNAKDGFRTFMKNHRFIIQVLADRQMENILLGDLTQQKTENTQG